MAKKIYTPENTALCNSFINAVLSSAPEGVNIKATRKDDKEVHFYIMNAPTELYDWSEYDTATRCVNIAFAIKKNENAAKLWEHLRGVALKWREENGGILLTAPVFIGSPRKSFAPIAKNTTLPRERVNTCDALKFAKGTPDREKNIAWGIFRECVKILNNLQTTCKDYAATEEWSVKDLEALPACVGRGEVESIEGDDAPRKFDFYGYAITCTPSALPCLLVRYCKNMAIKLDLRALPALKVVEESHPVAALESPAVATVEESPAVEDTPTAWEIVERVLNEEEARKKYPYLKENARGAEVSANLRKELREVWPSVRFSVRYKSFSGGDEITVKYSDGPRIEDVKAIAYRYQDHSADHTGDYWDYTPNAFNKVFGGVSFVFVERDFTPETIAKAAEVVARACPDLTKEIHREQFFEQCQFNGSDGEIIYKAIGSAAWIGPQSLARWVANLEDYTPAVEDTPTAWEIVERVLNEEEARAAVESAPAVEVVKPAPVKRVKIGRILLRLVVALLSVCVSALRLCIAALKLAERGRLVEVSREAVRRRVEAMRWSVARLWERVERCAFVAYARPVRGCRRIVVRSVEVVRWNAARLCERVERCAFVAYARPVRGCRRIVVRSVEVVRWNVSRTFEGLARWRGALALRAVRLANIVAFACITCARRLDNIAEGLGNM